MLPKTRIEDETLGPVSDQVTDKAKEAAQEAFDRGKSVAQDALEAAARYRPRRGQHEADAMTDSLRDKAQQVAETSS